MSNEITLTIDNVPTVFIRKDSIAAPVQVGPEVIIRTYSAGVHVGTIKERNGQEVTLTNARRIWCWKGALSLSEVATAGIIRKDSKISVVVPEITLLQAIEIIPVASGVDLSPTQK